MGKGNWRLEKDGIQAKKKPAEFSGLKFLAWLMLSLHQNHPIEMTV